MAENNAFLVVRSGVLSAFLVMVIVLSCSGTFAQDSTDSSSSGYGHRSSRSRTSSRSSSNGGIGNGLSVNDRDRDRRNRDSDREKRSRDRRHGSSSDDKSKDNDKDKKTVKSKKPTTHKKSGSSGGPKPVNIDFKMQVDPNTDVMYLESAGHEATLNIHALEKKTFVTRLVVYNPKQAPVARVRATLHYDPQVLGPVGIDDKVYSSLLKEPAKAIVDRKRGIVSYDAKFKTLQTDSLMNVVKLEWRALQPVESTPIRFVNNQDFTSGVFDKDMNNVLHQRGDDEANISDQAGLLDATVTVDPTDATVEQAEESGNAFSSIALASNITAGTAVGGMRISLHPREPQVSVGEEFLVDIDYVNPKHADIDTVNLKIRFDPSVLQVVDDDSGNWITRGLNIFDGDYHDNLPFDFHRKNVAYNATGTIDYEMGLGTRRNLPSRGTIATIRFRAISPAAATPITFTTGDKVTDTDSETSISFLGFNLIGTPGSRQESILNTSVSVLGYGG